MVSQNEINMQRSFMCQIYKEQVQTFIGHNTGFSHSYDLNKTYLKSLYDLFRASLSM